MTEYIVLLLLQVTIFSSITALLLMVVKWLFRRRIPPVLGMFLWLILLVRVICPVFPESQFSIYNLIPVGREIMFTLTYDYEADRLDGFAPKADLTKENPYVLDQEEPTDDKSSGKSGREESYAGAAEVNKQELYTLILVVFFCGIALNVVVQYMLYDSAIRRIYRFSTPNFDNRLERLYKETGVSLHLSENRLPELQLGESTMLAGIFHPKVILRRDADGMTDEEYRLLFAHELNHYKYGDNIILMLSTVVCCIFWFNPLLWYVRKLLREDIEVLCDARTLDTLEVDEAAYAHMLYRHTDHKRVLYAGSAMSVSGRRLKKRLQNISMKKKQSFLPRWVSMVLSVVMIAVCLTNPIIASESQYAVYIRNISELLGTNEKDMYMDTHVTVHEFLQKMAQVLKTVGGESLAQSIGNGNLERLKRMAADSVWVDSAVSVHLASIHPSEMLTMENCVLVLSAVTGLLGQRRQVTEVALLPKMLSVDTMEALCQNLPAEEAQLLYACYNRGVSGAEVSFEYIYTNAMMELITARINDDDAKEKFLGYYQEISLTAENLMQIRSHLNETIRYVGFGEKLYVCDRSITAEQAEILQEILGAAVAGQREDVYYLKDTEDGCSYRVAEVLFARAGLTVAEMYAEYARVGGTTYEYVQPDEYGMISEYNLQEFADRLQDETLFALFAENFQYYDSYTYTQADGTEMTVPLCYYALQETKTEQSALVVDQLMHRLNAVSFPYLAKAGSVRITGAISDTVKSAALEMIRYGFVEPTEGILSLKTEVSSGYCAQILCQFAASMTNANE